MTRNGVDIAVYVVLGLRSAFAFLVLGWILPVWGLELPDVDHVLFTDPMAFVEARESADCEGWLAEFSDHSVCVSLLLSQTPVPRQANSLIVRLKDADSMESFHPEVRQLAWASPFCGPRHKPDLLNLSAFPPNHDFRDWIFSRVFFFFPTNAAGRSLQEPLTRWHLGSNREPFFSWQVWLVWRRTQNATLEGVRIQWPIWFYSDEQVVGF